MSDEHDLLVLELPHDGRDILAIVADRPVGAIALGAAVARQVDGYHGVLRLQRFDLRGPIGCVASPSVDEDDGGLPLAPDAVVDVDTVGSQGELREAVDLRLWV